MLTYCRGVGFLKYWTLSNLPLFVLAAPMLYILLHSGLWAIDGGASAKTRPSQYNKKGATKPLPPKSGLVVDNTIVRRIAVPQVVLAALALTSYHVQITTRISSGYPVWYWWLASLIVENRETSIWGRKFHSASIITRWMVLYAIVQGGLFASFLPPA